MRDRRIFRILPDAADNPLRGKLRAKPGEIAAWRVGCPETRPVNLVHDSMTFRRRHCRSLDFHLRRSFASTTRSRAVTRPFHERGQEGKSVPLVSFGFIESSRAAASWKRAVTRVARSSITPDQTPKIESAAAQPFPS